MTTSKQKKQPTITLATPLRNLPGIGEKRSGLLARLGLEKVSDLLTFYPRKYEDRRHATRIAELKEGQTALIFACVESLNAGGGYGAKLQRTTAKLTDATGSITAVWFNRRGLDALLPRGTTAIFYGEITAFGGRLQMTNPETEVTKNPAEAKMTGIIPIYPCTEGLKQYWLRTFIAGTLSAVKEQIAENLPQELIKKRELISKKCAILSYHFPAGEQAWRQARKRLVYDELYCVQTELLARRRQMQKNKTAIKVNIGATYQTLFNTIPFALTNSQKQSITEILTDCGQKKPMYRLLQGDVGSGKSIVAIALAAAACDSGVQTAIMAPTEILAAQLCEQAQKLLEPAGAKIAFIKGGQRLSERNRLLAEIETGTAQIIVGTQALIFDTVKFCKLGVVIIDEQHRFGVEQRRALMQHGTAPHLLMMTATPIPRSLAQTLFSDLDISELKDKPAGRQKTETRLVTADGANMQRLLQFIIDEAAHGGRVYWICPKIETNYQLPNTKYQMGSDAKAPHLTNGAGYCAESGGSRRETKDKFRKLNKSRSDTTIHNSTFNTQHSIQSAKQRCEYLRQKLGALGVGLVHGAMDAEEKRQAIEKFRLGETKLLVGTTVLEVGIDIPQASVIVIEVAEMYGLAQLHQLRGRVGRGARRGVCILLTQTNDTETAQRLQTLLETDDGFKIAEADLALRGSGKLAGLEQHGISELRLAELQKDIELIRQTREDASLADSC